MDMDTIVQRAKEKDPKALAEIYRMYYSRMMGTCMKIIEEDRETASDLVHDAFVLAFVSLDKLRDNEKLGEWLTAIVRNVALKHRAQKRRMQIESLSAIGTNATFCADSCATTDSYVNSNDMLRLVDQLPKGYAKIFRLSVIEGFTHKEIADMLGIEPHSSSSQLSRAKRLLRQIILYKKFVVVLLLSALVPLYLILSHHDEQKTCSTSQERKEEKKHQPCCPGGVNTDIEYAVDDDGNVTWSKDTTRNMPVLDMAEEKHQTKETFIGEDTVINPVTMPEYHHLTNHKKKRKWQFLAAGAFGPALAQNIYKVVVVGNSDITSASNETTEEEQHDKPITFSLSLTKSLNDKWSIETGLQYSLLNSRFTQKSGSYVTVSNQTIHYLGLPLKLSYRMADYQRLSFYQSAGVTVHIPVYGKMEINGDYRHVSPSPQWAVSVGLGAQYELTPHVNLFVEPTVNWFISSGDDTCTIWTERPLMVTSPFGIRITW